MKIQTLTERDLRRPLELSEERLAQLGQDLRDITKQEIPEDSLHAINNLIGILREKYLINEGYIPNQDCYEEINQLKNSAQKLFSLIDMGLSYKTEHAFTQISFENNFCDENDHMYHAATHAEKLIGMCDLAIQSIQNSKGGGHSFRYVRDYMAIELARVLEPLGVDISTYEEGVFRNALQTFLEYCNDSTPKGKVDIKILKRFYPILKKVKDNYETAEPFILLQIQ